MCIDLLMLIDLLFAKTIKKKELLLNEVLSFSAKLRTTLILAIKNW